ncbi:hypothetical protein DCCM_3704 [Desulfocucumis palustris]|uniref:Type IV secretion system coupling protein TraD DNA-binding domain-containing protein n=1 Tax=Desulfocucumis palustris TaxID=1898651 RepID=A0A2L2XEC7_9FIRM|nr:type IV secretion system DNA-binding domain-containing protein [Desulfocucumis palustris]GBF34585.1 hypothetical protein DCCM_3704 [Desulfocucumis palustris]
MSRFNFMGVVLSAIGILGFACSLAALPNPPTVPALISAVLIAAGLAGGLAGAGLPYIVSVFAMSAWAIVQYTSGPLYRYLRNMPDKLIPEPVKYLKIMLFMEIILVMVFLLLGFRAIKNSRDMKALGSGESPVPSFLFRLKEAKKGEKPDCLDTVLCYDRKTKKPVTLQAKSRFLNTAIFGTTGTGKTRSMFVPLIEQDISRIARGNIMALTVIEPTKDLTDEAALICDKAGVPYVYVDPTNENTKKFNVLQGDKIIAAEATRSVLAALFGKQESFFGQVQQTAARNTVLLLKELRGDNLDIMDVLRTLRDAGKLQATVNQLKSRQGEADLVQYFEFELLGSMKDKYHQFAAGLRQQLEDIGGNRLLKRVLSGNSDINLDTHLRNGGVLIVNTAMGELMKKLSEVWGQYILMHLIAAIYRKPRETWQVSHALYIDELPKYLNPDIGFEDLLAIGRKYGNMTTAGIQSTSQLTLRLGKIEHTKTYLTLFRNKVVFGGMDATDAKLFSDEFGEKEVEMKQSTYENKIIVPSPWAKSYRTTRTLEKRYTYTELMELEGYQFIYRIVKNARLQPPGEGTGKLVDVEKLKPPSFVLPPQKQQAEKGTIRFMPPGERDSNFLEREGSGNTPAPSPKQSSGNAGGPASKTNGGNAIQNRPPETKKDGFWK